MKNIIQSFRFDYDGFFRFKMLDIEEEFYFSTSHPLTKQWVMKIIFCFREKDVLLFSYDEKTKEVIEINI